MYKNTFPQSSDKMEMEVTREATQYFLLCFANGGILGSNRKYSTGCIFSFVSKQVHTLFIKARDP